MWVDPRDALQVTSDPPAFGGEAERAWASPATAIEPAKFIAGVLINTYGLDELEGLSATVRTASGRRSTILATSSTDR